MTPTSHTACLAIANLLACPRSSLGRKPTEMRLRRMRAGDRIRAGGCRAEGQMPEVRRTKPPAAFVGAPARQFPRRTRPGAAPDLQQLRLAPGSARFRLPDVRSAAH